MEHRLLAWLEAQPSEIRSVVHCLSCANGAALYWDPWTEAVVVVCSPLAAHVLEHLPLDGAAIAIRR